MRKKFKESLKYTAVMFLMLLIAFSISKKIENRNLEKNLAQAWLDKGEECLEEPRTYVTLHDKKFHFECPVRDETPEERTYRELPSDYFDFDRRDDKEYVINYLSNNFPQYDCPLVDKYWKEGQPCWDFDNLLMFNPQEYYGRH